MAKSKSETKRVETLKAAAAKKGAVKVYEYQCPACTNVAIETSNQMLGVSVNCQKCGKLIELDDVKRYRKIKK